MEFRSINPFYYFGGDTLTIDNFFRILGRFEIAEWCNLIFVWVINVTMPCTIKVAHLV